MKKIGKYVVIFGAILSLVFTLLSTFLQADPYYVFSYLATAGVYFIVFGIVAFVIGCAAQSKSEKEDAESEE